MSLYTPEQIAAMQLAGYASGLIELGLVAPHMVVGLEDKVNAYFRAARLPEPFPKARMLEAAE